MMPALSSSINPLLSELVPEVSGTQYAEIIISGLCADSRKIQTGDLFIALPGTQVDATFYIDDAVNAGAIAVLIDSIEVVNSVMSSVPVIGINGLRKQVGFIAGRFYGYPTHHLWLTGITGTNGKTSVAGFIAQALHQKGPACVLLGTVGNGIVGQLKESTHTTLDALTLQYLFSEYVQQGITQAVMEVSSHGLVQNRVSGVAFDVAVFTNLSRDHLDYHKSMQAYAEAKKSLFETPDLSYAVINLDDGFSIKILEALSSNVLPVTFSSKGNPKAKIFAQKVIADNSGLSIEIDGFFGKAILNSPLIGFFNVENLLAACAVLLCREIPLTEAVSLLSKVTAPAGRMQTINLPSSPLVIVDYAHTPDALKVALNAVRQHCSGRIHVVFGCGGNRDMGKRPQMGKVAEEYADDIILTNDNPRHEDADKILGHILQGMRNVDKAVVIKDRSEAIKYAVINSSIDDVILVAGKGHEKWQIIGDEQVPFNDVEQVIFHLKGWGG